MQMITADLSRLQMAVGWWRICEGWAVLIILQSSHSADLRLMYWTGDLMLIILENDKKKKMTDGLVLNIRKTTKCGHALPLWIQGLSVIPHGSFQVKLGSIHQCPHNASLHWLLEMKQLLLFLSLIAVFTIFALAPSCLQLLHLPEFEEV